MTTARKSSQSTGQMSLNTEISETVADTTWKPLTLSAAGSPANLFRLRVGGKLKPILDGSGQSSPAWWMNYDPFMSLWRTSRGSIPQEVARSSLILPRSGTMRNGTLYLQQPLVPRTSVTGSSLWRTPQARDGEPRGQQHPDKRKSGGYSVSLAEQVIWPTPRAQSSRGTGPSRAGNKQDLQTKAGGQLNPTWVEWLMGFPLGWTDLEDLETP